MDGKTLQYVCLVIAAIILASEQGLKGAPNFRSQLPRFIASENWNFVPILLLSLAGLIWVFGQVTTRSLPPAIAVGPSSAQTSPAQVEPIQGAFIKPDAQLYAGKELADSTRASKIKCLARIVRCPSIECDPGARAVWTILSIGKWQLSGPTSDDFEKLSAEADSLPEQRLHPARVVVHSVVLDHCSVILRNVLTDIRVNSNDWEDPAMRGKGVEVLVGPRWIK